MAETAAAPKGKGLDFLTKKVGPFPVVVWGLIAVAAYYWYTHYGPGAQKAAAAPVGASGTGSPGGIGSNEITTALYSDDAAWAQAAISYLAGIGVPQQQATVEIDNYLRGLPNTAQGQSDVQLAINSIGPPPVTPPGAGSGGGGGGGTPVPPPTPVPGPPPPPVPGPGPFPSPGGGVPPPGPGPVPKPKHPHKPGRPEGDQRADREAERDRDQEAEKDRDQRDRRKDRRGR